MKHINFSCKYIAAIVVSVLAYSLANGQTGSFSYTVTTPNGNKVVKQKTLHRYNSTDYNTYWFVNPNTGDRHLFVNGTDDMGIIILNDRANDVDLVYTSKFEGDQLQLTAPDNHQYIKADNKVGPIHIHYTVFTAAEIAFTFKGPVTIGAGIDGDEHFGTIDGTLHLYRDPVYEKSDVMPGCACDQTIYATSYNPELGRTPSACENALMWKIFNAVQKAWTKVIPSISNQDSNPPAGSIVYRETGAYYDIRGPLSIIDPCNALNKPRGIVGVNSHTAMFTQSSLGLNFIKLPTSEELNPKKTDQMTLIKSLAATSDSISKLIMAKKISAEVAAKILKEKEEALSSGQPDYKKMEMEHNLMITLLVNVPASGIEMTLHDKAQTTLMKHDVAGAAFEMYTDGVKNSDGTWNPNKLYIGFGKFSVPALATSENGSPAEIVKPVYPATTNKLTVYNIVMKVEGAKDIMDKAIPVMDFNAIQQLIAK